MTDQRISTASDLSYRLIEQPGSDCARVEFEGTFEHQPVRWLATIVTLAREQPTPSPSPRRSFIEIDPGGADEHGRIAVRVGLAVTEVDAATIQKTMIMLRQYRRLRRGRMEFGPEYVPAAPPQP